MKFWVIQAFYCISGIGFFIQDLFERVSQGDAIIRAFIWPYAQKDRISAFFTDTMMGYFNSGINWIVGLL